MSDAVYTLTDLCELADVTPRTVRYYISQGLLRSPGASGPGARYGDGHLARLRLIRRLQREHLPLAEIRARLAAVSDEEAIAQAEASAGPPAGSALDYVRGVLASGALGSPGTRPLSSAPARQAPAFAPSSLARSAPGPLPALAEERPAEPPAAARSHWERHTLAPDVELHVRRPLTRSQNRAVARLLEVARQLLEEDQP
jgi:DNA-binding transcriptional MerR regulator